MENNNLNPVATIEMENGVNIIIELCPNEAPNTVNSFIFLANQGAFDHYNIQRIVPGYVVDASYSAFGQEVCKYLIANESTSHGFSNNIKVEPGVIAMGGYDEGIAGGEFFFPLSYHQKLDGNFPAFGKVIEGMDEILRFETVPLLKGSYPHNPEILLYSPIEALTIKKVWVETFGIQYKEPQRLLTAKLPLNWE